MAIYIVLAVVVLIAGFLVIVALKPAECVIQRSGLMKAPAEVVFPLLNDFHYWGSWSPWDKYDPNMKKTFSGAAAGEGAVYEWTGNKKMGAGKATLLESRPGERVVLKLAFFRPMKCTNQVTFTLTPKQGGTEVNWKMIGKNDFVGKMFGTFVNVDKMVGKDFESGLANLNQRAQEQMQGVKV